MKHNINPLIVTLGLFGLNNYDNTGKNSEEQLAHFSIVPDSNQNPDIPSNVYVIVLKNEPSLGDNPQIEAIGGYSVTSDDQTYINDLVDTQPATPITPIINTGQGQEGEIDYSSLLKKLNNLDQKGVGIYAIDSDGEIQYLGNLGLDSIDNTNFPSLSSLPTLGGIDAIVIYDDNIDPKELQPSQNLGGYLT